MRCSNCGGRKVRRDLENVYEIDDKRYFDMRFTCEECGHASYVTTTRESEIPKPRDTVTAITAPIKLKEYMPERKREEHVRKRKFTVEGSLSKLLNPLHNLKEMMIYVGAIILGVALELGGLYFERYLVDIRIDPLTGFVISLLIFVLGPIMIVGSAVYYVTKDRLKAILLGSMAVPLTIIVLSKMRFAV